MACIAELTTEITEDGLAAPLGSGGILKLSELKVIFCSMSGDIVCKLTSTLAEVVS